MRDEEFEDYISGLDLDDSQPPAGGWRLILSLAFQAGRDAEWNRIAKEVGKQRLIDMLLG